LTNAFNMNLVLTATFVWHLPLQDCKGRCQTKVAWLLRAVQPFISNFDFRIFGFGFNFLL